MKIKYSEWAKINNDLYGVFFDKNIDCAVLFKLTNLINTNNHNFNPSLVDKIFIPRNEYNNRKDIEKFDLIQLKQKIYEIEDNNNDKNPIMMIKARSVVTLYEEKYGKEKNKSTDKKTDNIKREEENGR